MPISILFHTLSAWCSFSVTKAPLRIQLWLPCDQALWKKINKWPPGKASPDPLARPSLARSSLCPLAPLGRGTTCHSRRGRQNLDSQALQPFEFKKVTFASPEGKNKVQGSPSISFLPWSVPGQPPGGPGPLSCAPRLSAWSSCVP